MSNIFTPMDSVCEIEHKKHLITERISVCVVEKIERVNMNKDVFSSYFYKLKKDHYNSIEIKALELKSIIDFISSAILYLNNDSCSEKSIDLKKYGEKNLDICVFRKDNHVYMNMNIGYAFDACVFIKEMKFIQDQLELDMKGKL